MQKIWMRMNIWKYSFSSILLFTFIHNVFIATNMNEWEWVLHYEVLFGTFTQFLFSRTHSSLLPKIKRIFKKEKSAIHPNTSFAKDLALYFHHDSRVNIGKEGERTLYHLDLGKERARGGLCKYFQRRNFARVNHTPRKSWTAVSLKALGNEMFVINRDWKCDFKMMMRKESCWEIWTFFYWNVCVAVAQLHLLEAYNSEVLQKHLISFTSQRKSTYVFNFYMKLSYIKIINR